MRENEHYDPLPEFEDLCKHWFADRKSDEAEKGNGVKPVLHRYKDGEGHYVRVGYGDAGNGTWQISPQGIDWLRSNRGLNPDNSFSQKDFEYLKRRKWVVNGGRPISSMAKSSGVRETTDVGVKTVVNTGVLKLVLTKGEDGTQYLVPARQGKRLNRILHESKLVPKDLADSRAKGMHSDKSRPGRSGKSIKVQAVIPYLAAESNLIFCPVTEVMRPCLFVVPQDKHTFRLAILLPGFEPVPRLAFNQRHMDTMLSVGQSNRVPLQRLERRNGHVSVSPVEGAYVIGVLNPVLEQSAYHLWTCGCSGLKANGTVFYGHTWADRSSPQGRVLAGAQCTLVWKSGQPSPPWPIDPEEIMTCVSDGEWLAARVVIPERPTQEQRWWLGDAGTSFTRKTVAIGST